MEDSQVIRSMDQNPIKKGGNKPLLIAGALLLFALILSSGAYFWGKVRQPSVKIVPTPTQFPFPTYSTSPTPSNLNPSTPSATSKLTPTTNLTPTPTLKTKILTSTKNLDGFRSSNNAGNDSLDIRAGRNSNLVTRGFVTFDLSSVPSGAKIESATMKLYQATVTGNPYSSGGALKVDHLTYGNTLDSTDYSLPALTSNISTLATNKTIEWKDADVTESVKDDIANARSVSQFRLHFTVEATDGDTTGDFVSFDSANSYAENSGHTPQLVVKYY